MLPATREQAFLSLRFGLDDGNNHIPQGVDEAFGVSRERGRQIESRALAKLRHLALAHPNRNSPPAQVSTQRMGSGKCLDGCTYPARIPLTSIKEILAVECSDF